MPYRPNVQIAYYHETKFAAYGLQPPRTWDELLAVAQHFKAEEGVGRVLLHGTLDLNTTTQVVELVWAAGGDPLILNDQGGVQAFTFLQQLAPYLAPETRRAKWNTTNTFLATESVYLARNWPSLRNDAYGTIEPWQAPYFMAVQEALRHARPRPHVSNGAEVDRALSAAFREVVYEGRPVQAALDRYHLQLQQGQKRLK